MRDRERDADPSTQAKKDVQKRHGIRAAADSDRDSLPGRNQMMARHIRGGSVNHRVRANTGIAPVVVLGQRV